MAGVTELTVRIINSTDVDLVFTKQLPDESLTNVQTLTSGTTTKLSVSADDKYYIIALPNSATTGTLEFELEEEVVVSSEDEEEDDVTFLITNITIFVILILLGIAA